MAGKLRVLVFFLYLPHLEMGSGLARRVFLGGGGMMHSTMTASRLLGRGP